MPKKKVTNTIKEIKTWGQNLKFPVNSIHDLGALAYVSRSHNREEVSEKLLQWQSRMLNHVEAEHDLKISVNKII